MRHRAYILSLALGLPMVVATSACSILPTFGSNKSAGLNRVDDLLSRVEQVQAESVLAKERADQALTLLREISADEFDGDPVAAYTNLLAAIDMSKKQAAKLGAGIKPLKTTADQVFVEWTASLESFGNTKLRRQSQVRMVETRARCEHIVSAATAAHIAYESLNADLRDQALFLQHDFNAASVAVVAQSLDALEMQSDELHERLDACVSASKSYIETSALRGQLAINGTDAKPAPRPAPTQDEGRKRRKLSETGEQAEGVPVAKKTAGGTP